MKAYLVIRETKRETPCSYGDYGKYYETEIDIISAHRNIDNAIKKVETETARETDKNIYYYWERIALE